MVLNNSEIFFRFIKTNSVDLVFASNLVEHLVWEEIDKMIPEVRRILKKSSKLVLIQPNYRLCSSNYFDDYTHRTILSDISLSDYLKSQGIKSGDTVIFQPDSEYEFYVDGQVLYRMYDSNITIKMS